MVGKEEEKAPIKVSDDLEVIYASGGFGVGVDIDGLIIIPFLTTIKAGEVEIAEEGPPMETSVKHLIMVPPQSAKILNRLLSNAVKEYEKRYGKIPMPPP